MSDYKTIRTYGQGEIIEKKSRFIGEVHYVKDLSEAEASIGDTQVGIIAFSAVCVKENQVLLPSGATSRVSSSNVVSNT